MADSSWFNSKKQYFAIDGVEIKRPTTFKIERYKISNLDRKANGDAYGEMVAHGKKRKFYFTYDAINNAEMNRILDVLFEAGGTNMFHTLTWKRGPGDNATKQTTVYAGSIPQTLHRTGGYWVWKDVSFDLIEQ